MFFRRKKPEVLPLPEGMTPSDIAFDKSICTGETTIGFRNRQTGYLEYAVVVHSPQDIADFYASYGLQPPDK